MRQKVEQHKIRINPIKKAIVNNLAKKIDKDDFLRQLYDNWEPLIKKTSDTEEEIRKATDRIKKSGLESVFKTANITETDLRKVIEDIKANKVETIHKPPEPGRNDLCPCGSGLKYKKCCLSKK